jgi:hypothetical protein
LDRPSNVTFAGQAHVFSTIDDLAKWLDNVRSVDLEGLAHRILDLYLVDELELGRP